MTSPSDRRGTEGPLADLQKHHFAFVGHGAMAQALGSMGDWAGFAASWNDLPEDGYMADGGRYRQRRFAAYSVARGGQRELKPPQPHYQSRDRNPLNGGIERWFEPLSDAVGSGESLHRILDYGLALLEDLRPDVHQWHAEVHQFRILTSTDAPGKPTPEGSHRDGVDFVIAMLIHRENVDRGTTDITDLEGRPLGSFTLAQPLDTALVDDRHVFHGVTPIEPKDPHQPAWRDVLVITWKADGAPGAPRM
ncbi:MAG: 2OG-Fe dioxygenase family protein [Planctomycetota bacterium]